MHANRTKTGSASLSAADARTYSISELAREFGITARALRFYEDKDLLHPARDGMTRVYSNRDRARLTLIVRGKRVGLPLADIREILDLYSMGGDERPQLRKSLEKFRKQVVELETQRQDIETALVELKQAITWAEQKLAEAAPGDETSHKIRAYDAVARAQMEDQD